MNDQIGHEPHNLLFNISLCFHLVNLKPFTLHHIPSWACQCPALPKSLPVVNKLCDYCHFACDQLRNPSPSGMLKNIPVYSSKKHLTSSVADECRMQHNTLPKTSLFLKINSGILVKAMNKKVMFKMNIRTMVLVLFFTKHSSVCRKCCIHCSPRVQ